MAPSSGHLLVPTTWRLVRFAFEKSTRFLRTQAQQATRKANSEFRSVHLHDHLRQPIPRYAALRQVQRRWVSRFANVTTRGVATSAKGRPVLDRSTYAASRIGNAIKNSTSRAPFASTLRPNLTGGTFCRTSGGYSLGSGRVGGARYFSHTPMAPTQVVNNVSAAVRAFWISGQKAQFDGIDPRSGEKRYRAVSALQEKASRAMTDVPKATPGSYIDFQVSPTITAFGPLSGVDGASKSLLGEGVMDLLSVDFARALRDLAVITNDLKRLSTLGDLPLTMEDRSTLRVRFPGCDARTVERLCDEIGVQRGIIGQDENFDSYAGVEIALLFPFAPSRAPSEFASPSGRFPTREDIDWKNMLSPGGTKSPKYSRESHTMTEYEDLAAEHNPWLSSPSGYSSLNYSEEEDVMYTAPAQHGALRTSDYEGLEGIYKFLEECDRARG